MAAAAGRARGKRTLDRVLSKAGAGSRTDARRWIADRRVAVNGRVVTNPELWIDPALDKVVLDGEPLRAVSRPISPPQAEGLPDDLPRPTERRTVYDLLHSAIAFCSLSAGRLGYQRPPRDDQRFVVRRDPDEPRVQGGENLS
jgi:16S rRNA U516 pseudouridylate synthase RsuA-like enzyme